MSTVKAIRGTRDLLPPDTELWNRVEATARAVFARYGFGEIRTPVFEATELFVRGVGEETDVVSKEMYTWEDGERFNKSKFIAGWLAKNEDDIFVQGQERRFSTSGGALLDLLVFRKSTKKLEFVAFKPKASRDAVLEIERLIQIARQTDPMNFDGKPILGHLVVPAGKARFVESTDKPHGIEIEEFAGDAFESTQQLTLRPENTAGVVRAYIEHKLAETGNLQKLYYIGPQFRRERPQRGRYRQFWQIGVEVIGPQSSGSESAIRDAEVLEMLASLLDELGVKGWRLALNSVGSATDRPRYIAALKAALEPVKASMCEDCQRRAETNPLRVLDCKVPEDQATIDALPKIAEYLDEASQAHFAEVKAALDACGVAYEVAPRLVRGLDYYTRTTFEFTVPDGSGLGTQNALLGGGRYDGLSEMLGGPKAPGIGFAIGEDRLILTLQAQDPLGSQSISAADIFLAPLGASQNAFALKVARQLRNVWLPNLRKLGFKVHVGDGNFRLKKSFELAERCRASFIGIIGDEEQRMEVVTVKDLVSGEQSKKTIAELISLLSQGDEALKRLKEDLADIRA